MKYVMRFSSVAVIFLMIILSVTFATQAKAAWTKKELSRVNALEKRIQILEQQLASQEVITLRYLATGGAGGTYNDICPGIDNLEGSQSASYIGRLSPKTDGLGNTVTDIYGNATSRAVYTCKVQFIVRKN